MKQELECSCGGIGKRHISASPTHFKSRGFPGNDMKKRSRGKQFKENKTEDLFDDHQYGKKYGEQKDHYKLGGN